MKIKLTNTDIHCIYNIIDFQNFNEDMPLWEDAIWIVQRKYIDFIEQIFDSVDFDSDLENIFELRYDQLSILFLLYSYFVFEYKEEFQTITGEDYEVGVSIREKLKQYLHDQNSSSKNKKK